jgi:hypothetical protein
MILFGLGINSHSVGGYGIRACWLGFLSEKF